MSPDVNTTCLEEIWNENPDMSMTEVRTLLGSFLFSADDVFKSKRIPEHKKEREFVDFPEPDNKDIQSIRIREPKLTMNTGIQFTYATPASRAH